jgi:hypothetical protein
MTNVSLNRRFGIRGFEAVLALATILAISLAGLAQAESAPPGARDQTVPTASGAAPPFIVIGFVGGFIKHDNLIHSEVQLAARLRQEYPAGVDVETFESYHGENAVKKILSLLDTNHDGMLTATEKKNARIILYGHSWGASEAITVARDLEKDNIPILLTIQVDSVAKFYQNDGVIPANVAKAANFYQSNGVVHGQTAIRAADPSRTKIIGNYQFDYKTTPYACNEYPWYDRIFVKSHTQIECDPKVWKQAEDLIRAQLPPAAPGEATTTK